MPRKLWLLFFTFARIAALVLGGGLAMLPVIEETFVRKKKLLTNEELLDVVALTQTVPGIIAANASVAIGMKIAGFAGALAALLGAVLPSFTVIVVIAWLFPSLTPDNPYYLGMFAGIRAGVTGLIAVTAWKLGKRTVTGKFEAAAVILFFAAAVSGTINPGLIIVAAVAVGGVRCRIVAVRIKRGERNGGEK